MDLSDGFQLDEPLLLLKWNMKPVDVATISGSSMINSSYFGISAKALNGLDVRIGLHFEDTALSRIEIIRASPIGLAESYVDFQNRLEAVFGPADVCLAADGGYNFYEWRRGGISISHSVIERFSLEEHVVISRHNTGKAW